MAQLTLKPLVYTRKKLLEYQREGVTVIHDVIGMEQKIMLEKNVLYNWHLKEVVDGIYDLEFEFHKQITTDNFRNNYAMYQVQRNAKGAACLVRVVD